MRQKVIALVTVVCILVVLLALEAPNIFVMIEYSGYNKMTLPLGSVKYYNEQGENRRNVNYSFCYSGVNSESPRKLEVWINPQPPLNNNFLSSFQATEGVTYTYDNYLEIKIYQVHQDNMVIFFKSEAYFPVY